MAAWATVLLIEVFNVSNVAVLTWLVVPFELFLWLAAGLLTIRLLKRIHISIAIKILALLIMTALGLHFTNWSAFQPTSYYATHKYAFKAVAAKVKDGSIGSSEEYYGERLPWHLSDLSTNGRAAVVGRHGDWPVVFLPQAMGIPDDAAGFAYFGGPDSSEVDANLFGANVRLSNGIDLGDGWWYLEPGD